MECNLAELEPLNLSGPKSTRTSQLAATTPLTTVSCCYSFIVALFAAFFWNFQLTVTPGKSKVINKALADMGMGRYQWSLFVLCGFGWLADKYVFPAHRTTL